ncbi:MAG: ATP-dependent helicase [bacterium]|nr:ATP-dependent helicase [bacterium]
MQLEEIIGKLNDYQKEAVLDDSNACIVNANVGSGKTTVLIAKILYLHECKQVPYKDMIVLTFTNKAAGEIKERLLKQQSDIPKEDLIGFGTFHSVALNLLKTKLPVERLGYTKEFLVIDPEEELDLVSQITAREKLTIKYKNRLKKRLEKAKKITDEEKKVSKYNDDLFHLVDLLKEEKVKQNKMTFDDLLSNTIQLMEEENIIPGFIIVDEVQDCDEMQLAFIDQMKKEGTRLFCVGDPNQVIYSWRGSSQSALYTLKFRYDARELSLPINYRSSNAILAAAKCFLQMGGRLEGKRKEGEKIVVKNQYDTFIEANDLAERIKKLHEEGLPYKEIAIFYRLQNQSQVFEDVFTKNEIPFEVSLKKTIKDIPVLNWVIRLLRASVNPKDISALTYVLSNKEYGEHFTEKEAVKLIAGTSKKSSRVLPCIYAFSTACSRLSTPQDLYNYFGLDMLIRPTSSSFLEDKESILKLFEVIFTYCKEHSLPLLEGGREFINSSSLYGINILKKDIDSQVDSVKLMTLHASKGLEFSHVFITGVNYGLIPLQTRSYEEEEEEQRLFFVGITRAKDYLELSYYTNPGSYQAAPGESRYIKRIPKELIQGEEKMAEKISLKELKRQVLMEKEEARLTKTKETAASSQVAESVSDMEEPSIQNQDANPVRKVSHKKYGIGTVVTEDDMMITVAFEGYGEKEFMKAFSELEELD